MSDTEQKDPSASPAYVLAQLSRAFVNSQTLDSPSARAKSSDKLGDWMRVFEGMIKGELKIGSRQPSKAPAWATLKVLKGGFSTGELLAGGPLQKHEVELLNRLLNPGSKPVPAIDPQSSPNQNPDRSILNSFYLTERGFNELNEMILSGNYKINVPEEGALLVVAWLVKNGHPDLAQKITEEIAGYISSLRFYPAPATESTVQDDDSVFIQTVSQTVNNFTQIRQHSDLAAHRESVTVWNPLTDRAYELVRETMIDSWPCQQFPDGWKERAKQFQKDYSELAKKHTLCKKHQRVGESFDVLRTGIYRSLNHKADMSGREIGRIRKIMLGIEAKRGTPDSDKCKNLRAAQTFTASQATSFELAKLMIKRLNKLPADGSLSSVEDLLEQVSQTESAEFKIPAQSNFPESFRRKIMRSVRAPISELVRCNLISSAEVLATVFPQISSKVRAANLNDPHLQEIYAQIYKAFRMRRSLLLHNLESQVKLEELPWIDAISKLSGQVQSGSDAEDTFTDLCKLLFTLFPQQIIPNKLLQELRALAKAAKLEIPLTDELAADIFMGDFTEKFVTSAKIAAKFLRGTLYERYYGLDYELVSRIDDLCSSRFGGPITSNQFAAMCQQLAGAVAKSNSFNPAVNGSIIEQQQILTTHNLAAIFDAVDLKNKFGDSFKTLPQNCFKWVCNRLLQNNDNNRHARLVQIKNCAYAWRQMVFFLSLMTETELTEFLTWAQDHLNKNVKANKEQIAALLYGLEGLQQPNSSWNLKPGVSTPMRFLGWSTGHHFLDREKIS